MKKLLSILGLSCVLSACVVYPQDEVTQSISNIRLPEQWKNHSFSNDSVALPEQAIEKDWWLMFHQPRLNELVGEALLRNNRLASAGYALQQAQLRARQSRNALFPTVSANVDANASRVFSNNALINERGGQSFSAGAAVSYELDLWRKLAKSSRLSEWEARASREDLRATQLVIEGSVVRLYWQLAYLNQKIRVSEGYLNQTQAMDKLVPHEALKTSVNPPSEQDALSVQHARAMQESDLSALRAQREQARNALAVFLNQTPNYRMSDEPLGLPNEALSRLSAGMPAQLLARRPDLQAGEIRLRKAMGSVEAAQASFYPNFSLTGRVNAGSNSLSEVLHQPEGAVALNVTLPFMNWREHQFNLRVSQAAYEQALADFRQNLFSALQEVEDSLLARGQYATQKERLAQADESAQALERLAFGQYQAGTLSVKSWVEAQTVSRVAAMAVLDNHYRQYINQVDLIMALGGGY